MTTKPCIKSMNLKPKDSGVGSKREFYYLSKPSVDMLRIGLVGLGPSTTTDDYLKCV